jgi:Cof subfamily protein (haloacid dehalogenase superfamily)
MAYPTYKMNCKLIAIDMDDTLLRSDLTISKHSRVVIKKVLQKGIRVVLATGRVPGSLLGAAKALGLNKSNGYLICGNGTMIVNSRTGEIIDEVKISPKIALSAFDLIDAEGFPVLIYDGNTVIVSRRNEFTDADEKLTGLTQIVADDFRSVMLEKGVRKMIVPADPSLLRPLEMILRNVLDTSITLFTSKPFFLEILPPGCDKGAALQKIAYRLGVSRAEVMAFGDSMNDEAMLRWVGCPVVMRNGDQRIKPLARIITDHTNDDDGVADILERYILADTPLPPAKS